MKNRSALLLATLFSLLSLLCAGQDASSGAREKGQAKHPVTVADTIEMTTTGGGSFLDQGYYADVVEFSPDGSRFAFVTQKGDLKKDVIAYSIWVYDTATALKSPRPRLVATMESSSNRPAISKLHWLQDDQTLFFLGEEPGHTPQIYRVKVGGKVERLTNEADEITSFSMDDRGDAFVYLTKLPEKPIFSEEELRRGFYVTPGHRWEDLYLNQRKFADKARVHVKASQMSAPLELPEALSGTTDEPLTISPNGKYAIIDATDLHPPMAWDDYQGLFVGNEITRSSKECLAGHTDSCPDTYWLIDLEAKSLRPLLDVPAFHSIKGWTSAAWTKDNTVLFINTLLPLGGASAGEQNARLHHVYAAVVDPADGRVQPIEEFKDPLADIMSLTDLGGGRFGLKAALAFQPSYEAREEDSKWEIREVPRDQIEPKRALSVKLEQGINEPPKLVAVDPQGQKTVLFDLNPQFAKMSFGHVEVFKWKASDGHPSAGELYYPVGYVAGRRYPLVIQTHGDSRDVFWIQGPYPTVNAAQPLANKGFFVLQMNMGEDHYDKAQLDDFLKVFSDTREAPYSATAVEGAIDELDRRGLIDRQRVGFSGFSRTVYQGEYLITHSRYPIAAAVMADGVDFGYVGCLYYMVPDFTSICENKNEGAPWGSTLANWKKNSPPMRLDKIHTPLLMQSISAPLGEWEIYAGLQWLKKPVELVNFYPEGEHELVRPQEKYLSEQSAVDWYCFWLKGEEDPDPAKAEQYARWHKLRDLHEADLKAMQEKQQKSGSIAATH